MGKVNFVSSLYVINQISRRLKPVDDGWQANAIEEIGAALNILHMVDSFEQTFCEITVSNYKAKLPCNIESILFFEYEGCWLPVTGHRKTFSSNSIDNHKLHRATLNVAYLQTSFETGTVKVHYDAIPCDNYGYPLIPDNQKLFDALQWYVTAQMLLSGYKHPELNYDKAIAYWERYYPRAQNSVNFPSTQDMERFKSMWVNIIPRINYQYDAYEEKVYTNNANADISDFTEPSIT